MKFKIITSVFILFIMHAVFATTWGISKAKDPISGQTIKVQSINSYGSYIYRWPSKYDGIFWPMTSPNYIRFNPASGYIAFGSDFEKINKDEIDRVSKLLKKNYDKSKAPKTHIEKVKWAQKVYKARGADEEMQIKFYCLLSYLTRNDKKESNKYKQKALDKINKYLKIAKPSDHRGHLYIVAGFYSSLLKSETDAAKYWDSPETFNVGKSKHAKNSQKYLKELLDSIKNGKYKKIYFGQSPE